MTAEPMFNLPNAFPYQSNRMTNLRKGDARTVPTKEQAAISQAETSSLI